MSLVLSGDASHITTPLAATVVGIANNGSGLERVQTSAPHLYGNGDFVALQVTISGSAVFQWGTIVVIDDDHFDLEGSTFTATGTGSAFDLSLTPQFRVPTDGDAASLQLSGMLSALQALADRTQALRQLMIDNSTRTCVFTANGRAFIPTWCTGLLILGCGGGGGGGGGPNGTTASSNYVSAGGGGAGAEHGLSFLYAIPAGATAIDVVVGAAGTAGAGATGSGGGHATPVNGTPGGTGGLTTCAWFDGADAGDFIARFRGGQGGGAGGPGPGAGVGAGPLSTVFTPGGRGWQYVTGPSGAFPRRGPGPGQIMNLIINAGALDVSPNVWDDSIYIDPVGPMLAGDGGASVNKGTEAAWVLAVSYAGADSLAGYVGGTAGAYGTTATYAGGAGGGGGGGGPYGAGAAGGGGGNGSLAGTGAAGTAGSAAAANTGGGGGGGGGGGDGLTGNGNGGNGGAGGKGAVQILFLGFPLISHA